MGATGSKEEGADGTTRSGNESSSPRATKGSRKKVIQQTAASTEAKVKKKKKALSNPPTAGGKTVRKKDQGEEASMSGNSYFSIMPRQYDELVKAIIRPPRAEYNMGRLGPRRFNFCARTFVRTDLILVNGRGLALRCSHWQPQAMDRGEEPLPCIIFTHGNSSSRLEALNHLPACLGMGMTMFAFDFAGSGKSEGAYVSLGWWEKEDLRVVVDHLRGSGTVSSIAVWGRSMGAVTALLYQAEDRKLLGPGESSVDAFVLDSPFSDFCQLAEELVAKGQRQITGGKTTHDAHNTAATAGYIPSMVTSIVLSMISSTIKTVAAFDVKDLSPIKNVNECFLPALFICALQDDFVGPHHVQALHNKYHGPKSIVYEEGDHNSLRSIEAQLAAASFLQRVLVVPKAWTLIPTNPQVAALYLTIPWEPCTTMDPLQASAMLPQYNSATATAASKLQLSQNNSIDDMIAPSASAPVVPPPSSMQPPEGDGVDEDEEEGSDEIISSAASKNTAARPTRISPEERERRKKAHYYCNRGNALEESGNFEAAIRAYRAAIAFYSGYADAHYNLGIALKNQGRIDEAIAHYRRTLAISPGHADAHNNLGVVYEDRGDAERAIDCYRSAVRHDPAHAEARINLADLLQSLGRLPEAIAQYELALNASPRDADALNNLGVALEASGQHENALEKYRAAVDSKPSHWDAQSNLADLLHVTGRLTEAAQVYRHLLEEHSPDDAQLAAALGHVLQANGKYNEALEAYQIAVRRDPDDAVAHNNMGSVLQASGHHQAACDAYARALDRDPNYAIAYFNLGVSLQSLKHFDQAINAYRQAVELRPGYADACNNMGLLLEVTRKIPEALAAYFAALDARPGYASSQTNACRLLNAIRLGGAIETMASVDDCECIGGNDTSLIFANDIITKASIQQKQSNSDNVEQPETPAIPKTPSLDPQSKKEKSDHQPLGGLHTPPTPAEQRTEMALSAEVASTTFDKEEEISIHSKLEGGLADDDDDEESHHASPTTTHRLFAQETSEKSSVERRISTNNVVMMEMLDDSPPPPARKPLTTRTSTESTPKRDIDSITEPSSDHRTNTKTSTYLEAAQSTVSGWFH